MNTKKPENPDAVAGPVDQLVRPTHWMDARGLVVTDEWLQSAKATSDYRAAYAIPCRQTRAGVRPIYVCRTCSGSGESDDCDYCHDCGGSGGLTGPVA